MPAGTYKGNTFFIVSFVERSFSSRKRSEALKDAFPTKYAVTKTPVIETAVKIAGELFFMVCLIEFNELGIFTLVLFVFKRKKKKYFVYYKVLLYFKLTADFCINVIKQTFGPVKLPFQNSDLESNYTNHDVCCDKHCAFLS